MSLNIQVSTATDPVERGQEIGRRWRDRIAGTVEDYDWLFRAAGLSESSVRRIADECLEALHGWDPALAAEARGIAAGAGLPVWRVGALNARTEILVRGAIAGLKECTTAALVVPGRPPRVLQTWDWIPQASNFTVLRHTSPAGLGVVTFAENGVVGKIGVNTAGLGVLFTLLCHRSDGSTTGVPVHAVVRRVLDNATTVAQAVAIARSAPVTASAALTVVTRNGEAATVELSPAGSAELRPTNDGYLLHTNHFLDPELTTGDRLVAVGDDTLPRMTALVGLRSALTGADRTAWARGLVSHWEDGAPICAHPRADADVTNRWETKMMLTFDLIRPSLIVQEGKPCEATADRWLEFVA
ncbi:C45 family autoproteolytic acyltransferase/hydrolase [Kribbella sp. GL6]|uniref:C45 family autoproteolytic acyltransferase/hydolase n=1 Tax=Kribbella sp. GL6 TaxID=3419765 RepID=UPI003D011A4B